MMRQLLQYLPQEQRTTNDDDDNNYNNILKPTDTTFTAGMVNYTVAVNHTAIKR